VNSKGLGHGQGLTKSLPPNAKRATDASTSRSQIPCTACGHYIDNLATRCPFCRTRTARGAEFDKMQAGAGRIDSIKRWIIVLIIAATTVWAWQCASDMIPSGF